MKLWRPISIIALACVILFSTCLSLPASALTAAEQKKLDELNAQSRELGNKINELQGQVNDLNAKAAELAAQAATIENQIAVLQNQQAKLKAEIELEQAEYEQILQDIDAVQKRINENSDTIGYVIAQYYYNDSVSTIERLASSENFSTFVDEEVRLSSVSDTLAAIVEENKNLKKELEVKKKNAEMILEDLKEQKAELAATEKQQAELLAQTRSSQADYVSRKNAVDAQKKALLNEQYRVNQEAAKLLNAQITSGDPNKGGYPYSKYCPSGIDSFVDRWGMYVCECVSYAAWKVEQNYGITLRWGGRGNAKQWPANARAAKYPVSSVPKYGAVAIRMSGTYGHAAWVEWTDGVTVKVSQYNWTRGEFSVMTVNKSMFDYYIYFGG